MPLARFAAVDAAPVVLGAQRVELAFPAALRRLIASEVYDSYGSLVRRRLAPSDLARRL